MYIKIKEVLQTIPEPPQTLSFKPGRYLSGTARKRNNPAVKIGGKLTKAVNSMEGGVSRQKGKGIGKEDNQGAGTQIEDVMNITPNILSRQRDQMDQEMLMPGRATDKELLVPRQQKSFETEMEIKGYQESRATGSFEMVYVESPGRKDLPGDGKGR